MIFNYGMCYNFYLWGKGSLDRFSVIYLVNGKVVIESEFMFLDIVYFVFWVYLFVCFINVLLDYRIS